MREQKTALIFPGQGTQYQGMGMDIFNISPVAKEFYEKAKDVLGFYTSFMSFNKHLQKRTLDRTDYAQIVIFVTNHALYELLRTEIPDIKYNATAGHSLGEYNALVASEALSFESALLLVKLRGKYMHKLSKKIDGGLLAVIGDVESNLAQKLNEFKNNGVYPALINTQRMMVLGGRKSDLKNAEEELERIGINTRSINVEGPFHTLYMKPAADYLRDDIKLTEFNLASIPIMANYSARFIIDPDDIKNELYSQIFNPVKWLESIQRMIEYGIKQFIVIGADKAEITRGMVSSILRGLPTKDSKEFKIRAVKDVRTLENAINDLIKQK